MRSVALYSKHESTTQLVSAAPFAQWPGRMYPGNLGSTIVTFIRNGQLWTIDPNGANAFDIVHQSTPVVGYSWAPTHEFLSFRTLDSNFAGTAAAKQLTSAAITGLIGDVPTTENTIGVDGGTPIPIAFSNPDVRYNNAIWNNNGTRLLFRQTANVSTVSPGTVVWWVSQNDQPGGIAIKTLPSSYSIPSVSYNAQDYMVIGNSASGVFTTTLAGTHEQSLSENALAGHPLPATLERVLWRPNHQNQSFLYAISSTFTGVTTGITRVRLLLGTLNGQVTRLATCACTQFAWSPDGNYIVYTTGSSYTILNVQNSSAFSITGERGSVPYWSPDGRFLLLDGTHTLTLINVATQQQETLLSDGQTSQAAEATATGSSVDTLLQPVANSLWAADSRHLIFLTRNRLLWQGQRLSTGNGLYSAAIDANGRPQGNPTLIDNGNDSQPGWTYEDANTSFLY